MSHKGSIVNPVLPAGLTVQQVRSAAVERDVSKMTPAQLRAWAMSPAGAAAVASLTRGQGLTVQPVAYVERRQSWGKGAGFAPANPLAFEAYTVEIVKGFPIRALRPVSQSRAVVAPVVVSAESVAYNVATREAVQADKDLQAEIQREVRKAEALELAKVAQRARAAARLADRGARALAKAQREQAKATAKRITQAKERGPSQSWAQDCERLLESVKPDSVEHMAISVAWRMASKAVRRVEGGSFKRSKSARKVEVMTARFLGRVKSAAIDRLVSKVTTGSDDDKGAAAWAGHAKLLSDTAKAEAFGAALAAVQSALAGHVPFDAARSSVCNGRRVWGASESVTVRAGGGRAVALLAGYTATDGREVSNSLALYGVAFEAARNSLTKLDGGGTGRKTGGESVTSSDSDDGAKAVARWDAAKAIGEFELTTVSGGRDARDGQLPARLRGWGATGGQRFDTLPAVGIDSQREQAAKIVAYRFGITRAGLLNPKEDGEDGADSCNGCLAILGCGGASAYNLRTKAQARRAVAGALLSVVSGFDGAVSRRVTAGGDQLAGVYSWEAKDFLPQVAASRWGASPTKFSAALRTMKIALEQGHTGGFAVETGRTPRLVPMKRPAENCAFA